MSSAIEGFDRYSASSRRIAIDHEKQLVTVDAQGSDGRAELMITPEQARWLASALWSHAEAAEKDPNEVA